MEAKDNRSIISGILAVLIIFGLDVLTEYLFKSNMGFSLPLYITFPVNMGLFFFFYFFLFPRFSFRNRK